MEEARSKAALKNAVEAERIAKVEVKRAKQARIDAEKIEESETSKVMLAAARGGARAKRDEESSKIKIKIAKDDIEQVTY